MEEFKTQLKNLATKKMDRREFTRELIPIVTEPIISSLPLALSPQSKFIRDIIVDSFTEYLESSRFEAVKRSSRIINERFEHMQPTERKELLAHVAKTALEMQTLIANQRALHGPSNANVGTALFGLTKVLIESTK